MLPLQLIRESPELVAQGVANKGEEINIDNILTLDRKVRQVIQEVEAMKAEKNRASERISQLKRTGVDVSNLIKEMQILVHRIKTLDKKLAVMKSDLNGKLLWVPNIPHPSVPVGEDERTNELIRTWGEMPEFDFEPRNHLEIAVDLQLLDMERGAVISGSGFPLYTGQGAVLERALINFMLDHHLQRGYREVRTPFITLRKAAETTGQLPKLEEDMYVIEHDDLFLIPTAEVPVTNIHRGEILTSKALPIYYVAYSPCFRREAGSYGRETRGLLRVHQFNKVELVKFVPPDTSYEELESLTSDAESILQALGLHYRVVALSTGDLSFAAAKCYDLEVWAPGEKRWLEVSSCSNYEDFQARRANIRYRRKDGKTEFVHTLNGSALATPRLMIALLESYQQDDGTVWLPEPLQPYLHTSVLK
ncbi:MAG: serine--tRNA ligase [Fidelibacterota bacterium]